MSDSHWTIDEGGAGVRLDRFLAAPARCGSRARATRALQQGKVFVNQTEVDVSMASTRLAAGDVVRLWNDRPGTATPRFRPRRVGELQIVYEDDAVLAVNKPAGLLVVPLERKSGAPSVLNYLEDLFRSHGKRRPFVVHRIDQDSSGLVLFAKEESAQKALAAQFKRREPERVYQAVVHGSPDPPRGTWRDHLVWDTKALLQKQARPGDSRADEAISDYHVVESLRETSLLEVRLQTGRRNQIRIQAALRGHPLVGERRYVGANTNLRPIPFGRQALHAWRLSFRHPITGSSIVLEAPPPADFADLVRRLRIHRSSRG